MCQLSNTFPELPLADDSIQIIDDTSSKSHGHMSSSSSLQGHRRRRRSIMKISTLDESINSISGSGSSSRRTSSSSSSGFRMPVSFDIVEIHEHAMILDESRNGPALTIDWKAMNTEVTTVQEFDCIRAASATCSSSSSHRNKKKKNRKQQKSPLDVGHRVAILIKAGYSKDELCNHFAEDVESSSSTTSPPPPSSCTAHPIKQQQQQQQQQKTNVYHKMKKAAKKFRNQVISNTATRVD